MTIQKIQKLHATLSCNQKLTLKPLFLTKNNRRENSDNRQKTNKTALSFLQFLFGSRE